MDYKYCKLCRRVEGSKKVGLLYNGVPCLRQDKETIEFRHHDEYGLICDDCFNAALERENAIILASRRDKEKSHEN